MVDLETVHGDLTVDDAEVSVTSEFVQKMNARGFKLLDVLHLASVLVILVVTVISALQPGFRWARAWELPVGRGSSVSLFVFSFLFLCLASLLRIRTARCHWTAPEG